MTTTQQRELRYIPLNDLKVSPLNVRKHGDMELDELKASIASNGIFQPLLVRKNCKGFDVVAGQRRLLASQALAKERGANDPLPCMVLESGDDALAVEASLAENFARLPMDEFDQYEAFAALHREGVSIEDVAAKFGVTERMVQQRLALANLEPAIVQAYRDEEIDARDLRLLTMASKRQQKAWLKLFKDPEEETPCGHWLKGWLLGGDAIAVDVALFDLAEYKGAITSDLFSEERFFADQTKFWKLQNKAVAQAQQAYLDDGWQDVVILDTGEAFNRYYGHTAYPKEKGGRVYISVRHNGEVEFHEGYLTDKEAKKLKTAEAKGDKAAKPERPELTKAMQTYLDLHRHNAVRNELLKHPSVALRLTVAHAICGSALWRVDCHYQNTNRNEAIDDSLEGSKGNAAFRAELEQVKKLLGMKKGESFSRSYLFELPTIFVRLLALTDEHVMRVLTFTMAYSLADGTQTAELLGQHLAVDMRDWWTPDQCFFDLFRDKEAINAMLAEVAGRTTARDALTKTAKVQKAAIEKQLAGQGGLKAPKDWQPRYMEFPMRGYTKRGGVSAITQGKAAAKLLKRSK